MMSLEKKIKDWEKQGENIYEKIKTESGQEKIKVNSIYSRCYNRKEYDFKYQKCKNCDYLFNILSYRDEQSKIFIPVGRKKGKEIKIISLKGRDEYLLRKDIRETNNVIGKKIYTFYKDEFFCISNIDWYSTDDMVVNISLICLIIRLYSARKNFPLFPDFLYFYNCTRSNFLVYISTDYESIEEFAKDPIYGNSFSPIAQKKKTSNFTPEVAKDILFQCILSLRFLSNLFFTHNELDYTKLRFNSKPVHIEYDKKMYVSSFRCVIFPSSYSSICIYNSKKDWWTRFFLDNSKLTTSESHNIPFDDYIIDVNGTKNFYNSAKSDIGEYIPDKTSADDYVSHRIFFYRINKKINHFLKMRRKRGSVWGLFSFDIVTLFCSLMTIPCFADTILCHTELKNTWYGLWRTGEAPIITKLLINQKNHLEFDNICTIIKKFYIRFDALSYLFDRLSNIGGSF